MDAVALVVEAGSGAADFVVPVAFVVVAACVDGFRVVVVSLTVVVETFVVSLMVVGGIVVGLVVVTDPLVGEVVATVVVGDWVVVLIVDSVALVVVEA